jgi:hypothetical protein
MGHDLEAPCALGSSDWDELYRARGDEVVAHRPAFTGDIFDTTQVLTPDGTAHTKTVMVVQHPCALRTNGVDLAGRLLVAEVRTHRVIPSEEWTNFIKLMPLPDLVPSVDTGRRNRAAFFSELYLADPNRLGPRLACLSPLGVNLLLQRWVNHSSRVVVASHQYNEVTCGPYEEADITEDWCAERLPDGLNVREATAECLGWLRQTHTAGGPMRQQLLEDHQRRTLVRQAARAYVRSLHP